MPVKRRTRPAVKAPTLSVANATLLASLVAELPYNRRPTWDCILKIATGQFKRPWTRQWLSRNPLVKTAYDAKLKQYRDFRSSGKAPIDRPPEYEAQKQRIARLERELADLKSTLAAYDRRLVLYVGNAIRHGLTMEKMEAPLTPVGLGQTDTLSIVGKAPR